MMRHIRRPKIRIDHPTTDDFLRASQMWGIPFRGYMRGKVFTITGWEIRKGKTSLVVSASGERWPAGYYHFIFPEQQM
jgi:hypothetical protein